MPWNLTWDDRTFVKSLLKGVVVKNKQRDTTTQSVLLYRHSQVESLPIVYSSGKNERERPGRLMLSHKHSQRMKILCPRVRYSQKIGSNDLLPGWHAQNSFGSARCWTLQKGSARSCVAIKNLYKTIELWQGPSKIPSAQSPPSLTILPMQKSILSHGLPERSSKASNDGI